MHVTQRGGSIFVTFVDDVDRSHYLHLLLKTSNKLLSTFMHTCA
jgi:hypothetical protein